MFCNKCGTELPDGSCFCSKCGNRIVVEEQIENSTVDEDSVCDILIVNYDYSKKPQLIKLLKEELGLTNVMEMLDKNPRIIGEVVYAEALYLKAQLESLNAVVEIHAQSAERLSYESEYEAICKAFSNMSPNDCIDILVTRNRAIQQYIDDKQKVLTGGFLSSAANMLFRRKDIKECNSLAPVINEEMAKSKQLMKQMLEALNEKYNNCYFTLSAEDTAEKMSETIFLYINNLGDFERFI